MPVRFDPRTKVILLIAVNSMLFINHSLVFELTLIVFSCAIVASGGRLKSSIKFMIVFLVALMIDLTILGYVGESFAFTLVSFIVVVIRKFIPLFMLAKWIVNTTEVGEFFAAMKNMKISQTVIIPLSVMFRYFPTVREEWSAIRISMKMRNIGLSIEHVLVPLLISAVNISDELSSAALCRGLDNPGEHGSYYEVGFKKQDLLFLSAMGVIVIMGCVLRGLPQ